MAIPRRPAIRNPSAHQSQPAAKAADQVFSLTCLVLPAQLAGDLQPTGPAGRLTALQGIREHWHRQPIPDHDLTTGQGSERRTGQGRPAERPGNPAMLGPANLAGHARTSRHREREVSSGDLAHAPVVGKICTMNPHLQVAAG